MAVVQIDGVFMGANVKTSTFEGNTKSSVVIDIYQPDSQQTDKTVQIKTDDISLINTFNKDYSMGSVFSCKAAASAYKNQTYYKLLKLEA